MLINQLRIVTALFLAAIGGSYGAWHTLALADDDKGQTRSSQADGKHPAPVAVSKPQSAPAPVTYRLTGSVRLEGTGEPIAGARVRVIAGSFNMRRPDERIAETGADGRFAIDVPARNIRVWLSDPPPGYVVSNIQEAMANLTVGAGQTVINRDFHVRKGTIWTFRFHQGANQKPSTGFVVVLPPAGPSRAEADQDGLAQLTLPPEGRKVSLALRETAPASPLQTGMLTMSLEWEPDFHPDQLEEVTRLAGNDRRFRLVDADAKTATLQMPSSVEPINDKGKLVIHVTIPYRESADFTAVTGQVLDEHGGPIAGAHVGLVAMARRDPDDISHTTTDRQGRYRLREIPRRAIDGKPLALRIVVTKDGYAGLESPALTLKEGGPDKPQVIDPVRLVRGVSLSGVVVDHHGGPLAGAWVEANQRLVGSGQSGSLQSTQTDNNGRFTFQHLHQGIVQLFVTNGTIFKSWSYLADGSREEARLPFPERRPELNIDPARLLAPPPMPLEPGQIAPEWQVGSWSDGRDRKLANMRGKVVILYFWGMTFGPSVSALPAVGKLAARFEPRGVEFLGIHNADLDREHVEKQARRVLAFKHAPLNLALDQTRVGNHARGKTADVYGVKAPPPVLIVIDRAGKIVFRSDTAAGDKNVAGVFMKMLMDPGAMTEEEANRLVERAIAEVIEAVL